MKNYLPILLIICSIHCEAQEYIFGYKFKKKMFDKGKLSYYQQSTKPDTSYIYGIKAGKLDSVIFRVDPEGATIYNLITFPKEKVFANILLRNKDSLFIYSSKDVDKVMLVEINWSALKKYKESTIRNEYFGINFDTHPSVKIPYSYNSFLATNIPARLFLTGSNKNEVTVDFLNLNVSFMRVHGVHKLYKDANRVPKDISWAFGLFAGGSLYSSLDSSKEDKQLPSLNFGGNIVFTLYKLNIALSLGNEFRFEKAQANMNNLYIGFGLGVDLWDFYKPEIKSE